LRTCSRSGETDDIRLLGFLLSPTPRLEPLGRDRTHGREMFLVQLQTLSSKPAAFEPPLEWFTLFLAADTAGDTTDELHEFAQRVLEHRCAYVSTWGLGCERLHDIFDETFVEEELDGREMPFLMTPWHDDGPLDEALWFALVNGLPVDVTYPELVGSSFVAATTRGVWADEIRRCLANSDAFVTEIVDREDSA
jgi:hypothetical protein